MFFVLTYGTASFGTQFGIWHDQKGGDVLIGVCGQNGHAMKAERLRYHGQIRSGEVRVLRRGMQTLALALLQ